MRVFRIAPTLLALKLMMRWRRYRKRVFSFLYQRRNSRQAQSTSSLSGEINQSASLLFPRTPVRAATIKTELDKFVVGQLEAKEQLSLLLSMHSAWDPSLNPLHPPPNAIVIGPTGCGKTFSIEVACNYLKMPFTIIDSTSLVPSGARNGTSLSDVVLQLSRASILGQRSIVFLDEFDKIAMRDDDANKEWKRDVQRVLLKFIEGGLDETRTNGGPPLVLAGGAFVGIDGLENRRKRTAAVERLLRSAPSNTIVSEDIINYGFIPEIVARLPAIIQYDALNENALLQILEHEINSPLLVWEKHFLQVGKRLTFSEPFRSAVAGRAAALHMGARGLQQIVFPALSRRAYAFEENGETLIEIGEDILEYRK